MKEVRYRWVEGAEYLIPINLIENFDTYLNTIESNNFDDWNLFNTLYDPYMLKTYISEIKLFIE